MMEWLRRRREERLDEEIAAHLRMAAQDRIDRGETPVEAERAARREFGNEGLVKEVTRQMWGWGSLDRLWRDVRYAGRTLRKSPGFTAVVAVTLALGIGANTALFSVMKAVLNPLPVPDAERVVMVWTGNLARGWHNVPASVPDYGDWKASGIFSYLSGFVDTGFNGCSPRSRRDNFQVAC